MNKKILCIDFSIFGNQYLNSIQDSINEFDYWLRDSYIDFSFDLAFYNDLITYLYRNTSNIEKNNIHFLIRQQDIIPYINKEAKNIIYNIDFFSDTKTHSNIVGNDSWVTYLLENNLIYEYKWINSFNSIDNKYTFCNINELKETLFNDVDELFITLSPEYINSKYHILFDNVLNTFNVLFDTQFMVEERVWDWNPYKYEDMNNCYCTLLTSESYVNAVLALSYCLKRNKSKYPLLVLASNIISNETLQLLETNNIKYQRIKDLRDNLWDVDIYNPTLIDNNSKLNKIYPFLLKDYEKTLYLDADTILLENIDYLFDSNDRKIICSKELEEKNIFLVDRVQDNTNDNFEILEVNSNLIHNKGKDKYWFNKSLKEVLNYIGIIYQFNNLIKENEHGTKTG